MVTFQIANSKSNLLAARHLCHDVYLNAGYINHSYQSRVIPGQSNPNDVFIVAIAEDKTVVGTLKLSCIQPCKTFELWNGKLYSRYASLIAQARNSNSFEIGSLAVDKHFSSLKISWGLYNLAYRWAISNRKDFGIISIDQRAFRALEMVGWYALQVGAAMDYFGSQTVPAIIPILEQPMSAVLKAQPWFQYQSV